MRNLSDILLMFCAPTCPPHPVSATKELLSGLRVVFVLHQPLLFLQSQTVSGTIQDLLRVLSWDKSIVYDGRKV